MPTLAGSVTIPFLTDYYQIGDRIKLIEGRDVNLGTNVALGQGELPTYPWVTAFSWHLEHDAQRTMLQLSDRRANRRGCDLGSDLRRMRDRQIAAANALDRSGDQSPYASAAQVAITTQIATYPTSANAFYACIPQQLTGSVAEGAFGDLQRVSGHDLRIQRGFADPGGGHRAGDSLRRRPLGIPVRWLTSISLNPAASQNR